MHHVFQKGEDSPQGSGPGEALVDSKEKQSDRRWLLVPILKITERKKQQKNSLRRSKKQSILNQRWVFFTRATQSYRYHPSPFRFFWDHIFVLTVVKLPLLWIWDYNEYLHFLLSSDLLWLW